jgi:hypothetical protein
VFWVSLLPVNNLTFWSESVFASGYAAHKRKNGQPNALRNCSAPGLIFAIRLNFSY